MIFEWLICFYSVDLMFITMNSFVGQECSLEWEKKGLFFGLVEFC